MSVSEHPIALRFEERAGGATRLLATVMALPLVDGIFPALVIAGALTSPVGILETGLLIFGGSATMAVVLAEMEGSPREQAVSILMIGAIIVPVAAAQAGLASTLDSLLNLEIFERFAGLVILAVAAKTASSEVGEYLPSPGVIVALGLVASLSPEGATLQIASDPDVIVRGAAAAAVGVAFALAVALLGPHLRGTVDIDRFRFGSAVALGVLALPILGLLQTDAPIALAVLAVTALLAYDPDADPVGDAGPTGDGAAATPIDEPILADVSDEDSAVDDAPNQIHVEAGISANGGDESDSPLTTNGGITATDDRNDHDGDDPERDERDGDQPEKDERDEDESGEDGWDPVYVEAGDDRAPWL